VAGVLTLKRTSATSHRCAAIVTVAAHAHARARHSATRLAKAASRELSCAAVSCCLCCSTRQGQTRRGAAAGGVAAGEYHGIQMHVCTLGCCPCLCICSSSCARARAHVRVSRHCMGAHVMHVYMCVGIAQRWMHVYMCVGIAKRWVWRHLRDGVPTVGDGLGCAWDQRRRVEEMPWRGAWWQQRVWWPKFGFGSCGPHARTQWREWAGAAVATGKRPQWRHTYGKEMQRAGGVDSSGEPQHPQHPPAE